MKGLLLSYFAGSKSSMTVLLISTVIFMLASVISYGQWHFYFFNVIVIFMIPSFFLSRVANFGNWMKYSRIMPITSRTIVLSYYILFTLLLSATVAATICLAAIVSFFSLRVMTMDSFISIILLVASMFTTFISFRVPVLILTDNDWRAAGIICLMLPLLQLYLVIGPSRTHDIIAAGEYPRLGGEHMEVFWQTLSNTLDYDGVLWMYSGVSLMLFICSAAITATYYKRGDK